MKTTTRVSIMIFIILILGASGYLCTISMQKKMAAIEEITGELEAVSSLSLSLHEAVSYLNNYMIKGDQEERERFKDASEEVKRLFEKVTEIEGRTNIDVSLENARLLYANIDNLAGELLKKEAPLGNKDAIMLILEIQQTADWITQFYIKVHELKDRGKLEKVVKEAESAGRWAGWIQIIGTAIALFVGFMLLKNKQ
ncbi:MAG: hypothetical protein AAB275_08540 [Deltaproteobacteria bacterium]